MRKGLFSSLVLALWLQAPSAFSAGRAWRVSNIPARTAFKGEIDAHLNALPVLLSTKRVGPAIQYVYAKLKPDDASADALIARQALVKILAKPEALDALAPKFEGPTLVRLGVMRGLIRELPGDERVRFQQALTRLVPSLAAVSVDELRGKLGELFDGSPNYIAPVDADASAETALKKTIEANRFILGRGLGDYTQNLGKEFARDLDALSADSHWIDGGAGFGEAARQYLIGGKDKARVTAISFAEPENGDGTFRHLTGRHFEDIPLAEIGAADLISDVFGVISYSPAPSEVLARYLRLLKPGGVIYLYLPSPYRGGLVRLPDGGEVALAEWLAAIPGLETSGDATVRVTRKPGRAVEIPRLELTDLEDHAPPLRVFMQTDDILVVE